MKFFNQRLRQGNEILSLYSMQCCSGVQAFSSNGYQAQMSRGWGVESVSDVSKNEPPCSDSYSRSGIFSAKFAGSANTFVHSAPNFLRIMTTEFTKTEGCASLL